MLRSPRQLSFINFRSERVSPTHFANILRPYTLFKSINRGITRENYLGANGLSETQRLIVKYFVHDYVNFHIRNRHSKTRRLVFSPARTGMGDRFHCLLFSYWAAVVSNRVFLVAWDDLFPFQQFMIPSKPELKLIYDETTDKPKLMKGGDGKMVPDALHMNRTHLKSFEKAFSSSTHTIFLKTEQIPHTISDDFLSQFNAPGLSLRTLGKTRADGTLLRAILHHVFRLSPAIEREVEKKTWRMELRRINERTRTPGIETMSLLFQKRRRRSYIGVHARIGKGVGERGSRFDKVSDDMEGVARCLASRAITVSYMSGCPSLPIFLATDTKAFRGIFRRVVREMSDGRIEVLTGGWDVAHSNYLKTKRHDNGTIVDNNDNRNVLLHTFIDLVLLGHSEHILALYSSFPRLASYLGDAGVLIELRNDLCLKGHGNRTRLL